MSFHFPKRTLTISPWYIISSINHIKLKKQIENLEVAGTIYTYTDGSKSKQDPGCGIHYGSSNLTVKWDVPA